MKVLTLIFFAIILFSSVNCSIAQDKMSIKFGKVTRADFNVKPPSIDSTPDAMVVADWGNTQIIGQTNAKYDGFNSQRNKVYVNTTLLKFTRKTRIKIINKNGLDAATVNIFLSNWANDTERVEGLKAYTYNLKGRRVVKTKLKSSNVISEIINPYLGSKRFTFPAVQDGSILEYSYTIESDISFNLKPWYFQSEYPCLWSEYKVSIPDVYKYLIKPQVYQSFFINKVDQTHGHFDYFYGSDTHGPYLQYDINASPQEMMNEMSNISAFSNQFSLAVVKENHTWVMKDIPAIKEESFSSTTMNNIEKLEFQFVAKYFP